MRLLPVESRPLASLAGAVLALRGSRTTCCRTAQGCLRDLGLEEVLHRVAQQPGMCTAAGLAVAPPGLVPLGAPFTVKPDLWYFLPVQLESSPGLGAVALPKPARGSSDFIALLGTHGFVELPPGPAGYGAGHVAPLHRW